MNRIKVIFVGHLKSIIFCLKKLKKVWIALGSRDILTMFILPIQEHGMVFHLFVSSSISFMSVLYFLKYRSFTFHLGLFPVSYGSWCYSKWNRFLISVSIFSLLVYKKAKDFCTFTLYHATLLNCCMIPSSLGVESFGFSI